MPSTRLNDVLDTIGKEYRPKKQDILAGICTLLAQWSLYWPNDPLGWELRKFLKGTPVARGGKVGTSVRMPEGK